MSERQCPACGFASETEAYIAGPGERPAQPVAGDLSVCPACGAVALYQRDGFGRLGVRAPTAQERRDLELDDLEARTRAGVGDGRAAHPLSWPGQP